MTAFKLKKKESERKGIRRVAHGRTEDAVELLRDVEADPVEAVHEARKDMKKLRATLTLVRPVLGDETYRRENGRFRDAARALSDVRDAQVRAETLDALAERFPTSHRPAAGGPSARSSSGTARRATESSNRCATRPRPRSSAVTARSTNGPWPLTASTSCAPASSARTRAAASASARLVTIPATRRCTSGASAPRICGTTCGSYGAAGRR